MTLPLVESGAIGDGMAAFAALAIGVLFGWCLERGGMGHARKLAGQFMLRDMAVLKLMLTAIVTAALGVFWLDRLGVLDASRVFVPPTFIMPIVIGGVLFGLGFLVAGLCPGTSCVAAATGRVDGLAVMVGLVLGIVTFGETLPLWEAVHGSTARGTLTIPDVMPIGRGGAVALTVLGALAAFALAERVERWSARRAGAA